MGRTNLDPIMTFPDGSHLLISTAWSKEGSFSCALYTARDLPCRIQPPRRNHLLGGARRRLQLCSTSLPAFS